MNVIEIMRRFLKYIVILIVTLSCTSSEYVEELNAYRSEKDRQFLVLESSPIPSFQKSYFKGLKYFNPKDNAIVKASFTELSVKDTVSFDIGDGKIEEYIKAGSLSFKYDNMILSLVAFYASPSNNTRLFIPFADRTSGVSTYGTGRYLYGNIVNGEVELDFNYASNPYCAYNEKYICFPAPDENILDVKIELGEKLYH